MLLFLARVSGYAWVRVLFLFSHVCLGTNPAAGFSVYVWVWVLFFWVCVGMAAVWGVSLGMGAGDPAYVYMSIYTYSKSV